DLRRNTLSRLTFQNVNRDPDWTADGKQVVYTSLRDGKWELYSKAADASGPEQQIFSSRDWIFGSSFSPDGSDLVFTQIDPATGPDIWVRSTRDSEKAHTLVD